LCLGLVVRQLNPRLRNAFVAVRPSDSPEVGFEEIAVDLLQARFRIASGWPTILEQSHY
jgi:hypothetical protein